MLPSKLQIRELAVGWDSLYIRVAERLAKRVTEIAVQFRRPPHLPFTPYAVEHLEVGSPNRRPSLMEGISLRFGAKAPASTLSIRTVNMDFLYRVGVHVGGSRRERDADP